jgi:hypothetical protein
MGLCQCNDAKREDGQLTTGKVHFHANLRDSDHEELGATKDGFYNARGGRKVEKESFTEEPKNEFVFEVSSNNHQEVHEEIKVARKTSELSVCAKSVEREEEPVRAKAAVVRKISELSLKSIKRTEEPEQGNLKYKI